MGRTRSRRSTRRRSSARSRSCCARPTGYWLNECPLNPGGYFIINESEKVLIAQEKMATNTVYVFAMKDGKYFLLLFLFFYYFFKLFFYFFIIL